MISVLEMNEELYLWRGKAWFHKYSQREKQNYANQQRERVLELSGKEQLGQDEEQLQLGFQDKKRG